MKLVSISDIHTKQWQLNSILPDGDVLVCAGDLTYNGTIMEVQDFCTWLGGFPKEKYKHRVIIAGNHDFGFEQNPDLFRKMVEDTGAIYLENESVVIDGFKFYGSPVTPRFFDWAFNVDRGSLIKMVWEKIPLDTDVLITHGPPMFHGDWVQNRYSPNGQNVGCEDLRNRLSIVKPQVHFFGHIHEGYGVSRIVHEDKSVTECVNCSTVNARYQVTNPPIVIDLTVPKSKVQSTTATQKAEPSVTP